MEKARQQNLLTFLIGCIGMLTWNHVYAMDEQPEHTQEASTMRLASQEIQITHDADAAVLEALLTDIRTKSGIYSILDDGDLFSITKALKSCILPSISRAISLRF